MNWWAMAGFAVLTLVAFALVVLIVHTSSSD